MSMGLHNDLQEKTSTERIYQFILVAGVIFASFNLRPAISSVGPVLELIRDDYGLQNWHAGLLTTLPLIAFAFLSPFVPQIGVRLTNELTVVFGMLLLILGMFVRTVPWVSLLFIGTIIAGAGIAVLNVLIPALIKQKFPLKVGIMTGIYSTTMGLVAGTASGLSVPFAEGLGWGWHMALLFWAIPAVIGVILWVYLAKKARDERKVETIAQADLEGAKPAFASNKGIWKSPLAWQMAMFMALQSVIFYVTISWLPEILKDIGYSAEGAGWMLSFMQYIGLPSSFLIPVLADRLRTQKGIVIGLGIGMLFGFTTLLFGTSEIMIVFAVAIIGLSVNGNFSLALTFFALRARNAQDASALSGMAQSLGYLFSALGPTLIGYLNDETGSWTWPIISLLTAVMLLVIFGLLVGRDRYVFDEPKRAKAT